MMHDTTHDINGASLSDIQDALSWYTSTQFRCVEALVHDSGSEHNFFD